MKKYFFMGAGLLLFAFNENAAAQIIGRDDRPVRKDTVMHAQKPISRDTIWNRRDAERRQDSIKWKRKADSAATAAKQKAAEISAKVGAALSYCSLKNVKGPKGETVYVDEYDRRYYINKDGSKVFMKRPPAPAGKK